MVEKECFVLFVSPPSFFSPLLVFVVGAKVGVSVAGMLDCDEEELVYVCADRWAEMRNVLGWGTWPSHAC